MNSGSNSFRNLIASGDLVISLFLSHKAFHPSHMQAYTHLHTDTATHKHMCTHTSTCSVCLHLLLSCSLSIHLCGRRARLCKNKSLKNNVFKNRCTCSPLNTHTKHTHAHTDAHLQKQSGIISAMNSKH